MENEETRLQPFLGRLENAHANTMSADKVIKKIFASCDINGSGVVHSRKLIEYMKPFLNQDKVALKKVQELLDPTHTNPDLDFNTFSNHMKEWVKKISKNDFLADCDSAQQIVENIKCTIPETTFSKKSANKKLLENQIIELEHQNKKITDKLNKVTIELTDALEVKENLLNQLDVSEKKIRDREQKINDLQLRIDTIHAEEVESNEERLKLSQQIIKFEKLSNDFMVRNAILNEDIKQLQIENDLLERQKDITLKNHEEAVQEIKSYLCQLNTQAIELANAEKIIKDLQIENNKLKTSIESYNCIIDKLTFEKTTLENALKSNYTSSGHKLENLTENMTESGKEMFMETSKESNCDDDFPLETLYFSATNGTLVNLQDELTKAALENSENCYNKSLNEDSFMINQLNQQIEDLKSQLSIISERESTLLVQNQSLQNNLNSKEDVIQSLRNKINEFFEQEANLLTTIKKLNMENKSEKSKISSLTLISDGLKKLVEKTEHKDNEILKQKEEVVNQLKTVEELCKEKEDVIVAKDVELRELKDEFKKHENLLWECVPGLLRKSPKNTILTCEKCLLNDSDKTNSLKSFNYGKLTLKNERLEIKIENLQHLTDKQKEMLINEQTKRVSLEKEVQMLNFENEILRTRLDDNYEKTEILETLQRLSMKFKNKKSILESLTMAAAMAFQVPNNLLERPSTDNPNLSVVCRNSIHVEDIYSTEAQMDKAANLLDYMLRDKTANITSRTIGCQTDSLSCTSLLKSPFLKADSSFSTENSNFEDYSEADLFDLDISPIIMEACLNDLRLSEDLSIMKAEIILEQGTKFDKIAALCLVDVEQITKKYLQQAAVMEKVEYQLVMELFACKTILEGCLYKAEGVNAAMTHLESALRQYAQISASGVLYGSLMQENRLINCMVFMVYYTKTLKGRLEEIENKFENTELQMKFQRILPKKPNAFNLDHTNELPRLSNRFKLDKMRFFMIWIGFIIVLCILLLYIINCNQIIWPVEIRGFNDLWVTPLVKIYRTGPPPT